MVLAALGMVDHVIVFSENTPLNTILAIKPDLIIKGGDYDADLTDPSDKRYIVGKNEAKAWGGQAQTIPLVDGYSTTGLLAKR
jgi:D-beta-D-heptose 7-phosphate kinase/D-beta-D-heptose 1-phosphate adenosyltransferase